MTLAQLHSFVLVARLGSVKAAAAELEVTEAAVSVAVAALRRELGDELFVRSGRTIALTPGGRRLAALAGEILGLAEQARRSVPEGEGSRLVQIGATGLVAEHVGPLIEAFTGREAGLEVSVEEVGGALFPDLLERRRADIALGPPPAAERAETIASVPFLRCRLVVVATPDHPLVSASEVPPSALSGQRWLVGPPELDPTTGTGLFLARHRIEPGSVAHFTSQAGAVAAAAAGEGIALVLAHAVLGELRRRALARIPVRGTPVVELWHASTLGLGRALPAALALQRFATTPEARQALLTGRAGMAPSRARPSVHVTLWRSVAAAVSASGDR